MLCLERQINPVRLDGDGSGNMGAKALLCQPADWLPVRLYICMR